MIILGLMGSIAMGKSVAARQFQSQGIRVCNADLEVHKMLNYGGIAVKKVAEVFPNVEKSGKIDRRSLAAIVFSNVDALVKLEEILHPLVQKCEKKFLEKASRDKQAFVVLEIPLLFESGRDQSCDYTICVNAPSFLQYYRAMRRADMTEERFNFISTRQLPNSEKCGKSDFIISSGLGKKFSLRPILYVMKVLRLKDSIKYARNRFGY